MYGKGIKILYGSYTFCRYKVWMLVAHEIDCLLHTICVPLPYWYLAHTYAVIFEWFSLPRAPNIISSAGSVFLEPGSTTVSNTYMVLLLGPRSICYRRRPARNANAVDQDRAAFRSEKVARRNINRTAFEEALEKARYTARPLRQFWKSLDQTPSKQLCCARHCHFLWISTIIGIFPFAATLSLFNRRPPKN